MKFKTTSIAASREILANDHFVATTYDCSNIEADENGVINAGTIIPANDDTACGVLLSDVDKNYNPNGTIVIHGFIMSEKLPAAVSETAKTALKQITFM